MNNIYNKKYLKIHKAIHDIFFIYKTKNILF